MISLVCVGAARIAALSDGILAIGNLRSLAGRHRTGQTTMQFDR